MAGTSDRMPGESGSALRNDLALGVKVAIGLAVLTGIEYVIAVTIEQPLLWLLPVVLVKGWLILDYFMHFRHFLAEMAEGGN